VGDSGVGCIIVAEVIADRKDNQDQPKCGPGARQGEGFSLPIDLDIPFMDDPPADQRSANEGDDPITDIGPVPLPSIIEGIEGPEEEEGGKDEEFRESQSPFLGGLDSRVQKIYKSEIYPQRGLFEDFNQSFHSGRIIMERDI
jgi:hypothetical protein